MKRIERFDKYMAVKRLNDNKVTVEVGLSVGTLGKSRKPNRDLSEKVIERLLNFYKDLSREWLLYGSGEMLRPQTATAENGAVSMNGTEIKENTIQVNTDATIAQLIAEVAAQRRVTEKVLEQNSELIAIIAGKKKEENQ